jgi:Flp pilus assembly CpaF family ATPase
LKNTSFKFPTKKDLTQSFLKNLKKRYLHFLNHKKLFKIEEQVKLLIDEFGVTKEDLDFDYISLWYKTTIELEYLANLLNYSCHEVIVHNENEAQIIAPDKRWSKTLGIEREDYQLSLETLAHGHDQEWSYNSPFVSFPCQLHGHDVRVTLIHACLTRENISKLYLRKVHQELTQLEQLNFGLETKRLLTKIVAEKKNVLICGPTGSGKTTLLKAMLNEIPADEHLLLMEDCAEVELNRPLTTHLIAGQNHEDKTLESFCSYSMRLRPDRIVLGEVRGREIAPFLLAMNTGHKGLMATLHANSAIDCVSRISNLFGMYSSQQFLSQENITKLVCQNIDIVIYMKEREVCEIIKLTGSEGACPYYTQEFNKAA